MAGDWNTQPTVDGSFLGKFAPETVYHYYDGPRVFTVRGTDGRIYYVHQVDEEPGYSVFLVLAATELDLEALEHGLFTMRRFILSADPLWAVTESYPAGGIEVRPVSPALVPGDMLPRQSAFLFSPLVRTVLSKAASKV